MIKIIEIKETITDTRLTDDIYDIQKLIKRVINRLEFTEELNRDDYNYLSILIEKTKVALIKAYEIIKL